MLSDFHFLDPWWLLALAPLAALLWWSRRGSADANAWRRVIDARLLRVLTIEPDQINGFAARLPMRLLALAWLIAVLALANPTFERKPVPTFSGGVARVVVLDLSRSMLAADLTPNRLARARYKVADILARVKDGRVGLIAFAGDAFTVAPLTQDADTITAMLEALLPEIMPVPGSRPDLAIARAAELLTQAGATQGEVVMLTDDAGDERARAAAEALRAAGHDLAVIGVGTTEGAPVPGVRRADGPVMSKLDVPALRALARAGGGRYTTITANDQDLDTVLKADTAGHSLPAELTDAQAELWYPLGPWIALALLPLGALAFRRGWLLGMLPVLLVSTVALHPRPVMASGWDDLWLRRDQQAAQAMAAQDHERARELAHDPQRRGSAAYRAGDYQAAVDDFATGDTATDHYNRGNALARLGALEQALEAYDQALELESGHQDARYNHDQIEELLKQQQEQQQDQQSQDSEQQDDSDQDHRQSQSQQSENQQGENDKQQDGSSQDQSADDTSAGQQGEQQSDDSESSPGEGENEQNAGQTPDDQQSSDSGDPSDSGQQDSPQSVASGQDQQDAEDKPEAGRDQAAEQQAAEDYRSAAAEAQANQDNADQPQAADASGEPELSPEEREARAAADQWLRRIPDDPAGLLRRKFLYQYSQRANPEHGVAAGEPW